MTEADMELARLFYWGAAALTLLFGWWAIKTWWRPLRYLLVALVASLLFTPYFVEQPSMNPATPEAKNENIVPAFIVMIYDAANDRDDWQNAIKKAGTPVATVATAASVLALIFAWLLSSRTEKGNPYLPEENKQQAKKSRKRKNDNPYLPEDFEPQSK